MSRDPGKASTYFLADWPVLAIVTLTGIIYNVGLVAGPYFEGQLAQCLYDIINGRAAGADMVRLAGIYLLTISAVQAARAVKRFYVRRFANDTSRDMRRTIYAGLVRQSRQDDPGIGNAMTQAVADVDACAEGMRKFTTELFDTGIVMASYFVFLLAYDWRLTMIAMIFPPLAYLAAGALRKVIYRYNAEYKAASGRLSDLTLDRVDNALLYRRTGLEKIHDDAYSGALRDYERRAVLAGIWSSTLSPIYNAVSLTGIIFVVWLGAKNLTGTGNAVWDLAMFTAYVSCFAKLAVKSSHAANLFNAVQKAQVSWKRVKPLLRRPSAAKGREEPLSGPAELSISAAGIGFPGARPLVTGLSLAAEPGMIIGIAGPVASGKTALGRAFLGEVPYTGQIRIGGKELSELTDRQRSRIVGYLGHQSELISGSLAENIRLGDPGDLAGALKAVDLDREAARLPQGADSEIGPAGSLLSGGQQQRAALARVLYRKFPIVVLDDPFSAVDQKTEDKIMGYLRAELKDSVVLLISHRLRWFPKLDRIVWITGGKAVSGTFAELMGDPGFAEAYRDQNGRGADLDA